MSGVNNLRGICVLTIAHQDQDMLLDVLTNARKLKLDRHIDFIKYLLPSDTRELEDLG